MLRQKFPFIKQQNNSGMSQNQVLIIINLGLE